MAQISIYLFINVDYCCSYPGEKLKKSMKIRKNVRSSFIINGKLKDCKFIIKVNIVESSMSLPLHSSLVGLF